MDNVISNLGHTYKMGLDSVVEQDLGGLALDVILFLYLAQGQTCKDKRRY